MRLILRSFVLFASIAQAEAAAAQLVVRVQAGGVGVAGAEVSAWNPGVRLAGARTDGSGTAHLALQGAPMSDAFVLVRRIGFAPARIVLAGRDSLVITLTEVPVALPVLALDTRPLHCPAVPDAMAESLWIAAASRYGHGATRLYFNWSGARVQETVTGDQRGYGDGTELHSVGRGGTLPTPEGRGDAMLREPPPYAAYERHLNISGESWRWRYAPLEESAAEHFVSEKFHARHVFVVLGRSAGASVIGFCPRDPSTPEIMGELQIGADTLLRAARWSFQVPHDDEGAGGEAAFSVTRFENTDYLVSIRGSAWRRAGRDLYNQDRFELFSWRLRRERRSQATRSGPSASSHPARDHEYESASLSPFNQRQRGEAGRRLPVRLSRRSRAVLQTS